MRHCIPKFVKRGAPKVPASKFQDLGGSEIVNHVGGSVLGRHSQRLLPSSMNHGLRELRLLGDMSDVNPAARVSALCDLGGLVPGPGFDGGAGHLLTKVEGASGVLGLGKVNEVVVGLLTEDME